MTIRNPLLALLLLPLPLLAAAPQGPITIEADRLELSQMDGRSHYQGNVEMQQGEMQLRADNLQLEQQQGQLQRAIADGQPVFLRLPDEQSGGLIRAEARYIDYHFGQDRIELKGEAVLWRGGDEFRGEHLIYHITQRTVQAFGRTNGADEGGGDGRVRIILQPEAQP